MLTRTEIARRIRTARKSRHLSQADVGAQLDPQRTYAAVSDIERGQTVLSTELLAQLGTILGVSPVWFLDDVAAQQAHDTEAWAQVGLLWAFIAKKGLMREAAAFCERWTGDQECTRPAQEG
jgi:transcriptional regulator with XRE-family HTH domain